MEGCGDNFRKQVDEAEVDEGGKDGETRSKGRGQVSGRKNCGSANCVGRTEG